MRIKAFSWLVSQHSKNYTLQNCPVIIDGFNYFYHTYKNSSLPFEFGCECNEFANHIRQHLAMFQKANVTCYIFFKGGIENIQSNREKHTERLNSELYDPGVTSWALEPIFKHEVLKQVLKEMGVKYTICKMEAKQQCIALARELNCPIISHDIEFCFTNVPYISHFLPLVLNETNDGILCRLFVLNEFLDAYSLTKEKLAIFILLTHEGMVPEGIFKCFFTYLNIPLSPHNRNVCLLKWLSRQSSKESIISMIFRFILKQDQKLFLEKECEALLFIDRQTDIGVPAKYFLNDEYDKTNQEHWFEHLVASQVIPAQYINLHTDSYIKYNRALEDTSSRKAYLVVLDIIKLAFSLLTTEDNEEFHVYSDDGDLNTVKVDRSALMSAHGVKLDINVLKNNFKHVDVRKLFASFFGKDLESALEDIPDDAKLLFIALAWCASKSNYFANSEILSVILSYIMLNFISSFIAENTDTDFSSKSTAKRFNITPDDIMNTKDALFKYFSIRNIELREIFNRKLLHPLVEFQYSLQHFNFLNTLCGEPFLPTIYSKTYNGTFVYKVLYEIKNKYNDNYEDFLCILRCAPGVVVFIQYIMNSIKKVL